MKIVKLPGDELLSNYLDGTARLVLVDPTQEIIDEIKQKYPDGLDIKELKIYYGKDTDSVIDFEIDGNKYPIKGVINIEKKSNDIKLKNVIMEHDIYYDFIINSTIKEAKLILETRKLGYYEVYKEVRPYLATIKNNNSNNYERVILNSENLNENDYIYLSEDVINVISKSGKLYINYKNNNSKTNKTINLIYSNWSNTNISIEFLHDECEINKITDTYNVESILNGEVTAKNLIFNKSDTNILKFYSSFENCIIPLELWGNYTVEDILKPYINKNKIKISFEELSRGYFNGFSFDTLNIHLLMSNKDFNKLILHDDYFNDGFELRGAVSLKIENELTGEIITLDHIEFKSEYREHYFKVNYLPSDYVINALKEFYTSQTIMFYFGTVPYDKYNYEKDSDFIDEKKNIQKSYYYSPEEKQQKIEELAQQYSTKYTDEQQIKEHANEYSFSVIDKYNELVEELERVKNKVIDLPDRAQQATAEKEKEFMIAKATNNLYSIYKYKDIPEELIDKLPLVDIKQEEMEITTKGGYYLKIGNITTELKKYFNIVFKNDILEAHPYGPSNEAYQPTSIIETVSNIYYHVFTLPEFIHAVYCGLFDNTKKLIRNIGYDNTDPKLTIDTKFIEQFLNKKN